MKIQKERVKKILVISLSNLGDIILTFPVIDILRRDFDQADLSIMVGPKGKPLLIDNPKIDHLYVYDKQMPFKNKVRWINELRKERFDFIVDLRSTLFPVFLMPTYATALFRKRLKNEHARDEHLRVLYTAYPADVSKERYAFFSGEHDQELLKPQLAGQLSEDDKFIMVAPGAADARKCWTEEGFAQTADFLAQEHGFKIIFVGDGQDASMVSRIKARMRISAIDLSDKATLTQVGYLLSRASLAVTTDSCVMHLASYLGTPTVALFGPTDPVRFGPWGDWAGFIRKNQDCLACQMNEHHVKHTCMEAITAEDVIAVAQRLLNSRF